MDGVRRGFARHPLHLLHVIVECGRQGHGQARQQRLAVHVHIGIEFKAAGTPDRLGRFCRRRRLGGWRENSQLVVHRDEIAADIHGVGDCIPVFLLLLHVRHDGGHLAAGVLCRANMVRRDQCARRVRIEDVHAHGEQERRTVLQCRLHDMADERAHLPEGETSRKRFNGEETCFHVLRLAWLRKPDAFVGRLLDGIEVHNLIPQFPSLIVVNPWGDTVCEPVWIGEQCAPVD